MYAPPPPANARRNGLAAGGPVLAICCLLFILFLIAATIVLALIPVYVQKDITASKTTKTNTLVLTPSPSSGKRQVVVNQTLCEGDLVEPTMTNIENAVNKALGLPDGTTIITVARNTAQTISRRRRGYGLLGKRGVGPIVTYAPTVLDKTKCWICGNPNYLNNATPFSVTVTIYYAGSVCPAQTVTYRVTADGAYVFPPLSSTTVSPTSSMG